MLGLPRAFPRRLLIFLSRFWRFGLYAVNQVPIGLAGNLTTEEPPLVRSLPSVKRITSTFLEEG